MLFSSSILLEKSSLNMSSEFSSPSSSDCSQDSVFSYYDYYDWRIFSTMLVRSYADCFFGPKMKAISRSLAKNDQGNQITLTFGLVKVNLILVEIFLFNFLDEIGIRFIGNHCEFSITVIGVIVRFDLYRLNNS